LTKVLIWFGVAVVCVGVLALGGWLIYQRQGRQIRNLIARLETLEAQQPDQRPPTVSGALPIPEPSAQEDGEQGPTPPEDVLAGYTSHINRVIDGAEGGSLGLADQAVFFVYQHLEEPYRPAQLADELHISLRTLERGLVETFDCTPGQLITAMKMREARRLFESGDFRVNEVATRLGFSSPFYFSRRFRTFFGVPPSEYRRGSAGGE
jgi:AraC-like DNA-binding protein